MTGKGSVLEEPGVKGNRQRFLIVNENAFAEGLSFPYLQLHDVTASGLRTLSLFNKGMNC